MREGGGHQNQEVCQLLYGNFNFQQLLNRDSRGNRGGRGDRDGGALRAQVFDLAFDGHIRLVRFLPKMQFPLTRFAGAPCPREPFPFACPALVSLNND